MTLQCVRVDGKLAGESPAASSTLKADLVLLAMGFLGPRAGRPGRSAGVEARPARQRRGQYDQTTRPSSDKVFACGDMRRGQSLVVWAIREGRQCARAVDEYLMGATDLPR